MSVQIILDEDYQKVCYPGQMISGRVECQFNKELTVGAIKVGFIGRAKTKWYEWTLYGIKLGLKWYFGEEVYMDDEYNLVPGRENLQISAGKHVYPFSCVLPTQLPTSFEGRYGKVEYFITATVDRPWKFDYKSKISINVFSPLNLNLIPSLKDPVFNSEEKTTCRSCWSQDEGALTFNVALRKTGHVPGQEIILGAYIKNMTNVPVTSVKFKIVAKYEFISLRPSINDRYFEKQIVDIEEGPVGARDEKSWSTSLTLPTNFEYPNLMSCRIMDVYYILVAKAVLPFPHLNLTVEVPLVVGNFPLTGVITTRPTPVSTDECSGGFPPAGTMPYDPSTDAGAAVPTGATTRYPSVASAAHPEGIPPPYLGTSDSYASPKQTGFLVPEEDHHNLLENEQLQIN